MASDRLDGDRTSRCLARVDIVPLSETGVLTPINDAARWAVDAGDMMHGAHRLAEDADPVSTANLLMDGNHSSN